MAWVMLGRTSMKLTIVLLVAAILLPVAAVTLASRDGRGATHNNIILPPAAVATR
jgi:hypothetical protein